MQRDSGLSQLTRTHTPMQRVLAATDGGGGVMRTAVTAGNFHEVNFRDKVIVASVVEAFRAQGGRTIPDNVEQLPFDIL